MSLARAEAARNTRTAVEDKIITGFHAVEERVLSFSRKRKSPEYRIFYSSSGPRIKKILAAAEQAGIECIKCDDRKLSELVKPLPESLRDHRGIVLSVHGEAAGKSTSVNFDEWIKTAAAESAGKCTVVVLDRITDPHNVGAIIRSCDQFGASLVVVPEHKSAGAKDESEVISRSSAGANAWVPVAVVTNLVRTVEKLKDSGFWIYGADAGGESCGKISFADKSVLVMGSEGSGISALLKKQCDSIVSIPTCGKIDSLNVSVAAGVLLYELHRRNLEV